MILEYIRWYSIIFRQLKEMLKAIANPPASCWGVIRSINTPRAQVDIQSVSISTSRKAPGRLWRFAPEPSLCTAFALFFDFLHIDGLGTVSWSPSGLGWHQNRHKMGWTSVQFIFFQNLWLDMFDFLHLYSLHFKVCSWFLSLCLAVSIPAPDMEIMFGLSWSLRSC